MRRSVIVSVVVLASVIAGACGAIDEQESSGTQTTSEPVAPDATVGVAVNAGHVASCVEQVKFGAYTDDVWSQTWVEVGESEIGAIGYCTQVGEQTPARLAEIHDGWLQVVAFLAAADPEGAAVPETVAASALTVTRVVDGDTVDMSDGSTIRLIGIDSPEQGACGYDEATRNLETMVLAKQVILTPGARDDVDRYGRLLRYIDVDGIDANRAQLEGGFAIARYDSNDGYGRHTREDDYRAVDYVTPMASGCPRPDAAAATPSPAPAPAPAPAPPSEREPDIAPTGPDLDCGDIQRKVWVGSNDYHGLDADGDGWGCDSSG